MGEKETTFDPGDRPEGPTADEDAGRSVKNGDAGEESGGRTFGEPLFSDVRNLVDLTGTV